MAGLQKSAVAYLSAHVAGEKEKNTKSKWNDELGPGVKRKCAHTGRDVLHRVDEAAAGIRNVERR